MEKYEDDNNNVLHWAAGYHDISYLPPDFQIISLAEMERAYVELVIALCGDNIPLAAQRLQVSPSTLYRKRTLWRACD